MRSLHDARIDIVDGTSIDATHRKLILGVVMATLLHLLGIDHERLTYLYQGRRFRLTDVSGKVVSAVIA
jgi:Protein of unknown function (DUF1501)